jgi:hypothetical protein
MYDQSNYVEASINGLYILVKKKLNRKVSNYYWNKYREIGGKDRCFNVQPEQHAMQNAWD